jgi:hypothetical protein
VTASPGSEPPRDDLRVVYCGGCNPAIDRVKVAEDVRAAAGGQPVTLYVSGCQRACASGRRLVAAPGEAAVIVAGEQVEARATAAPQIAAAVVERIGPAGDDVAPGPADTGQSSAGE